MSAILEAPPAPPAEADAGADESFRLSRHLLIRPAGGGLVVESSLDGESFAPTPSILRLLLALARPRRLADLLEAAGPEQRDAVARFVAEAHRRGLLTRVGADGAAEEERGALAHWEFHDLLFHARSRRGRTRGPIGATWHLRGRLPPEPPVRADADGGPAISLARPDLERLGREEAPLTRVLETRRSRYSVRPVPAGALGEFLFRVFRVTGISGEKTAEHDGRMLRRVYPSGGSLHSLEVYVVPWACEGVERGIYRYDAHTHALAPVAPFGPDAEALLREAETATGGQLPGYPPVLLVLASRFRRVMWKYQGLAYSAILKEVGAAYQTMYLVATAMGLSPCATGAGDAERFARATGTDYHHEGSVGEFVLGGCDLEQAG